MTPNRRLRISATVLGLSVLVGGCGAAESGTPVPTWGRPQNTGGMDALLSGTVSWDLENSCVFLGRDGVRFPVVLASGARLEGEPPALTLPSGAVVREGDFISGGGGYLSRASLGGLDIPIDVPPDECFLPENTFGEVAVFNNSPDTPAPAEG
jgi:hypothetical protein